MKHGYLADPLDLFEASYGVPDNFYIPEAANARGGSSSVAMPPPALPDESIEAESAQNGPGGPGSVVAETSGGLVINLLFDAAAMAAPLSFRQGIEQAATILSGAISDKITVNLNIDYSGTGGGAAAGPDNGQYVSYTTVRADLVNDATPGDTTFNALPSGSTIQGQSSVAVWDAQLKLFGLLGANDTTTDDGSATFATDINPNLLVGVALHELTHAMGRVPYGPQPDIFDLFRFTSPGTRLFLNGATAPAAYFSLDGGTTKVADYGQTSDASDFLNGGVQGSNDPFNEFYSGSTLQQLTAIDLKQLDALGFHLTSSRPDLSEYVAVNKTTVAAGSSITIDAYDMNLGNAVAGPSTAQIYLSTDPTITTSDTVLATLTTSETLATISQPGYYDHQTVAVTLPSNLAPGTYYIGGIADYNGVVAESSSIGPTYNVVPITVTAPPLADLSEYVAVNKTTVAAGSSITIDAYDMNLGNAVAGPSTAQIYLSTDPTITTSDTVLATLTTSETLATVSQPGYYDHQTVAVTLPGNLAPGTYYIGGIADYNGVVAESSSIGPTYNVVPITVTAPPLADLSEYVAVNKTTVAAGSSITIDAYDMNLGNAVAGPSTAQIYLSTNPTITTSDMVLATLTTSQTLATVSQPGYYDHQTVAVTLPGNLALGTYYIGGIADYNGAVAESTSIGPTYNVVQITVTSPASQSITPTQPAVASDVTTQLAATTVNASVLFAGSGRDNFVFHANPGNGPAASYPPAPDHVEFNHAFVAATLDPAACHPFDTSASLSPSGPGADALHHLHDFHIV